MIHKQDENGLDSNRTNQDDRNVHPFRSGASASGARFFEIHVKGHLDTKWSDWFEGMELKLMDCGETVLSGRIADQAALMGILNMLNRLNLTILSINEVKGE